MKKIIPALPLLLVAALAVSACSKQDGAANALAVNEVVLNDEDAVAEGNFGGTDLLADNAGDAENASLGNEAGTPGNDR